MRFRRDVHDIDLFSGGLAEDPLPGAVLGPTFSCIVAGVFEALKFGDRFFYEHGNQAGSFAAGDFGFTLRSLTDVNMRHYYVCVDIR